MAKNEEAFDTGKLSRGKERWVMTKDRSKRTLSELGRELIGGGGSRRKKRVV